MKQGLCTSHALGCVPSNSWFPTALFPSKFGKGTAVPKIFNYCKSGQNRSWQRERYPVGLLRKWPSLNVTRECTQEGAFTKHQNVRGTSSRGCSSCDTRHATICYKTYVLFAELHLQKMKFRLASFGERLCRSTVSGGFKLGFGFFKMLLALHNN